MQWFQRQAFLFLVLLWAFSQSLCTHWPGTAAAFAGAPWRPLGPQLARARVAGRAAGTGEGSGFGGRGRRAAGRGSQSREADGWLLRCASAALALILALSVPWGTTSAVMPASPQRRVLSVGDLHGDFRHTQLILRDLGVLGPDGGWAGGDAILVQTGDVTDRGDASGPIFAQLFRLQDEAPLANGEVILLFGNHELMNLENDFRYATPEDTASLAPAKAREEAFSTEGWVGKRLRERGQAVALLGAERGLARPVLYVHAGVVPELAGAAAREGDGPQVADALNRAVRRLLAGPAETIRAQNSPLLGGEGPFWTRYLALSPEGPGLCEDLGASLKVFGAERMVVGHTAQADGRVHQRCDGRLILGDTLISEAYTGTSHPSAVEVAADGTATALYPGTGEREVLPTPAPER